MSNLTSPQLRLLLKPVNPNRVSKLPKTGLAHMEAWDIRRQLIRTFGFGGFDIETIALELVAETSELRRKKNREGVEYGDPYTAWTVIYRAQIRLTVKDPAGHLIGRWEDGAVGDSANQPSRGDAHDMAVKTALSQGLKRCATNLGDQFGLSLYNDGSRDPVVNWSAAHPPETIIGQPGPAEPVHEDPPVRPEPQPAPYGALGAPHDAEALRAADLYAEDPTPPLAAAAPTAPTQLDLAYAEMMDAAREANYEQQLPDQFKRSFGHDIQQGTVAEYRQATDLLKQGAAA